MALFTGLTFCAVAFFIGLWGRFFRALPVERSASLLT